MYKVLNYLGFIPSLVRTESEKQEEKKGWLNQNCLSKAECRMGTKRYLTSSETGELSLSQKFIGRISFGNELVFSA